MALKVCVVGAGAAGLCAARHLAKHPDRFHTTVFETSETVGGTWVYNDEVGKDKYGNPLHSSMYEHMRTNLPKEIMAFSDFPFSSVDKESFLHHSKIRQYLEDYCEHHQLRPSIRFRTRVDLVEPTSKGSKGSWRVKTTDLPSRSNSEDVFDAIFICNGHYFSPLFAAIDDIHKFVGNRLHSHDYRNAGDMRGKCVAVLGAAASGTDISLEVSGVASRVFMCHNKPPIPSELPANVTQVKGIQRCTGPGEFTLADGNQISNVDVLLYCTGYNFSFPFLSDSCGVSVKEQQVRPLYKHVINAKHPSMAFIGIPMLVCPFPMFDIQVQWFCKILSGESLLPSEGEMEADIEQERHEQAKAGVASRHFHKMGDKQWGYDDELAGRANIPGVPKAVVELYGKVHARRQAVLLRYKEDRFKKNDAGLFVLCD